MRPFHQTQKVHKTSNIRATVRKLRLRNY